MHQRRSTYIGLPIQNFTWSYFRKSSMYKNMYIKLHERDCTVQSQIVTSLNFIQVLLIPDPALYNLLCVFLAVDHVVVFSDFPIYHGPKGCNFNKTWRKLVSAGGRWKLFLTFARRDLIEIKTKKRTSNGLLLIVMTVFLDAWMGQIDSLRERNTIRYYLVCMLFCSSIALNRLARCFWMMFEK